MANKLDYSAHENFTNRELSWLDFNYRVLDESRDKTVPLLERVNFLGITQSNLDEFFSVRVASISKLVSFNYHKPDASGLTAKEQLAKIHQKAHRMLTKQYNTYNRSLLPALDQAGVHLEEISELNDEQYDFVREYFHDELFPVLTPMADDSSRPFPFISNDSLNLAIRLSKKGESQKDAYYSVLPIPTSLGRLVKLPGSYNDFILIENIIKEFIGQFFMSYLPQTIVTFRVIRDLDLDVAEEDTSDLIKKVQQQLRQREHGRVMRLEVEASIDKHMRKRLLKKLDVPEQALYEINGPLDLDFLKKWPGMVIGHDDLRYPPFKGYESEDLSRENNIFEAIAKKDRFMQYPYDRFDPVVEFIRQAAFDSQVLAIKMTLYRVSGSSPIIKYLGNAARNGKQVTVLVELKARFDEENNVHWAQQLEKMGCHVIYGLLGLKTHSKLTMVIRKEESGIRRYMHLGTGNYNDATAHFYTDMGLFTSRNDIGEDVANIFNMLSGYSEPPYFHQLHISPDGIRKFITSKLDAAIKISEKGHEVRIFMKMNSLSDKKIIIKLYEASHAGVKVDLLVRGICCLKPGQPKISENITVHSIVGRFLEHSRIYAFTSRGQTEVYLSSADMMTRNLDRRVEQLFPILDPEIKNRVINIYQHMWDDNVKTRQLQTNGNYEKIDRRGKGSLDSQEYFMDQANKKTKIQKDTIKAQEDKNRFQPMTTPRRTLDSPTERESEK